LVNEWEINGGLGLMEESGNVGRRRSGLLSGEEKKKSGEWGFWASLYRLWGVC